MLFVFIILSYVVNVYTTPALQCKNGCTSEIYCRGDLLKDVQLAQIYDGSKTFVDMKLLNSEDVIISEYKKWKSFNPNPSKPQLKKFFDQYFAEDPLETCQLPDFNQNPTLVQNILDENYKNWAREVNKIWNELASRVPSDVKNHPENHSYIYIPNCFIKAGGFFTEMYYWDTYWIIQGLLLCDMHTTVRGILENFFHLVNVLGYVPNGNRKYYIGRSQPPLLIRMMDTYYTLTKDEQFLIQNLEYLETEFQWWQENRMVEVKKNGEIFQMARYYTEICEPRPEGYWQDYHLVESLNDKLDRQQLLVSLRSTAESGWDFSSREMRPNFRNNTISLQNSDTQNIIMVDLNAMLHFNAGKLAEWYERLGNFQKSFQYKTIADQLFNAIQKVLWNEEDGIWYDWDLVKCEQRKIFYPSNFSPLWTKSFEKHQIQPDKILKYLVKERIISSSHQPLYYGIPTSTCNTTQQWDYTNEWAPLQSIMIEGFRNINNTETDTLAFKWSALWLKTNYIGFQNSGHMYEKYNAISIGDSGGGGGYKTQLGFGWTNGFCLMLLDYYAKEVHSNDFDDFQPAPPPKQCSLLSSESKINS